MSTQSGSGYGSTPPGPDGPRPAWAQSPNGDGGDGRKRPNMAVFWTVAVVVAVVLGVGGYLLGHSNGKSDYDPGTAGYKHIYDAGYDAGQAAGNATGTAAGQKAGEAAGQKAGQQAGLEQGKKQGQAQGTQQGASAALGGFGSWQTGSFYVVQLGQGPQSEVPYVITSRVLMDPDFDYAVCANDPSSLCTFPKGSSGGGGATTTTGTTGG